MEMETKEINDILVVKPLVKRIDASIATAFKGQMIDLITKGKIKITLNLAQVDFIDSSGLGAIISVLKTVAPKGSLAICCPTTPVMSLFKLTRMDKVFFIASTEEDALKVFEGK
jgi:anti-sigma B factor antagonist